MKAYLLVVLLLLLNGEALSQADPYIISRQGYVRVLPLHQSWSVDGGVKFSETSLVTTVYAPLSRVAGMTLRAAGGGSGGDVASLSGLSDVQASFSYHLEKANMVLGLQVNVPSGKKKLTQEEFETSGLFSNNIFHLQIPNFGTGFNVEPSAVWAVPVSDGFVLGLGASYQYKGKFQPLDEFGDYDPGDEFLVTGGFDVRLGEGATLSADAVFSAFGKDKLDDEVVFAAGSKIVVHAQLRKDFGDNELALGVRYRSRAKSEFQVGDKLVSEDEKVEPDQVELAGSYAMRVNDRFSVSILAEGRFYQETSAAFSGITLGGVGLAPVLTLSDNVSLPARLKYYTGSMKGGGTLTGFEAGIGVSMNF